MLQLVCRGRHLVEHRPHERGVARVVLDDEHPQPRVLRAVSGVPRGRVDHAAEPRTSGMLTVNVLPSPGTESTVIAPPRRSAMRRQIARPMPVPS